MAIFYKEFMNSMVEDNEIVDAEAVDFLNDYIKNNPTKVVEVVSYVVYDYNTFILAKITDLEVD